MAIVHAESSVEIFEGLLAFEYHINKKTFFKFQYNFSVLREIKIIDIQRSLIYDRSETLRLKKTERTKPLTTDRVYSV